MEGYDAANPQHRFVMALLFGELANERTLQITSADARMIYNWFAREALNGTYLPPFDEPVKAVPSTI